MGFLTRFSLKNPTVIVVAVIMALLGGIYTTSNLERETMPDVSIPIVAIITPYPGAAPSDVYDKVTQPLERSLSEVPGMQELSSTSADSVSVVVGEFRYSADMDEAETEMVRAIEDVELPETALESSIARISFGSQPILRLAVYGGESTEELRAFVRDTVLPRLEAQEGVGEIQTTDEDGDAIRIEFDQDELDEHGLSADAVVQQLQAANLSFPVGSVTVDDTSEPIRVSGTIENVEDVENLLVAIYPNMNAFFGETLSLMGESMGELGGAVGELGKAVGEIGGAVGGLGAAVGELGAGMGELGAGMGEMAAGMEEMGEGLGTQIGLVAALQDTQAQLLDAKIALSQAQMVLLDPTATPQEVAAAQATIAQLEATIPVLEGAVAEIQAQLAAAQEAMAAGAATSALPEVPEASTEQLEAPSAGLGSGSMPDAPEDLEAVEPEEPEIELVTLGDLATVEWDPDGGQVMSRSMGKPAVLIDIIKSQDANTVEVSELVQAEMEALESQSPDGVEFALTYDSAVQINDSINDVVREGLLGAIFAFLVILLFLRDWRATIISAISIPLSVVLALLLVGQSDVTLNIMVLGGLTVAIGRVVDDSIVVIENIYRHLQIGDDRSPAMIRRAVGEVSAAITSSTLTTVAVFAPMAFVSGIVSKIFTPFALTVSIALLASLLVSLTVVPMVAKWALLNKGKVRALDEEVARTTGTYPRLLKWSLGHKKQVMALAGLLFVGSMALVPLVGVGFMPPSAEQYATVDVRFPAGTTSGRVDEALADIEEIVEDEEEVVYYQVAVAASSGFDVASGSNQGLVFMQLEEEADAKEFVDRLRDLLAPLKDEGARVAVAQVDVSGAGANSVDAIITGPDFGDVQVAAAAIEHVMQDIEAIDNVSSNLSDEQTQITVDVDQAAAAEYGLNAAMVAGTVRALVADLEAGTIEVDERDVDVTYSVHIDDVEGAEDIAARELSTPLGETVKIGDVARVEETQTPVAVLTLDERRFASVSASVGERDSGAVIRDIEAAIDDLSLPEGVEVEVGGMAEMMNESFEQLGLAMVIAVFAVYLVMVIAFGEAIAPLAIMGSLPLATIGGIIALFIAGIPLDMPAMIGALMLIGIVTTNAIVLIDRVQQKLAEGLPRKEALLVAGTDRIRPVLMTAFTTIMALVPMASGLISGTLMSQSLAVVAVGGLISSTGLTLIVVPVVYDFLEGLKDRILKLETPAGESLDPAAG
jgi:HAE1 family hydrophobic/amphiphilic exporter-1